MKKRGITTSLQFIQSASNPKYKAKLKLKMGKVEKKSVPKGKKKLAREKNISINLEKMSKAEYKMYSNSREIIVKNFSIKISKGSVEINKKKHHSKNKTINLEFKKRLSSFVLECCDATYVEKTRQTLKSTEPKKGKPIAMVKTLNVLINEGWTKCKRDFKSTGLSIDVGDIILAKMSTYSPWPARLKGFTSNKKRAHVFFFGESNSGHVNVSEIVPFNDCLNVIRFLLLRKVSRFHKGIAEVEAICNVSPEFSLLKELNAIEDTKQNE